MSAKVKGSTANAAVVKSAGRVFEVLELFRSARRQLTAAEVGHALGYPKSSTNALLRSLVALGYLVVDGRTSRLFSFNGRHAARGLDTVDCAGVR